MYEANITKSQDGSFYALVVRVEEDGYKVVLNSYKGRYFKTLKGAEKSTANYIAKYCR